MDKKEFTKKYYEVFKVITQFTVIHPVTALNISYSYNQGNLDLVKKNLFFPDIQTKTGIGSIPRKKVNSIFDNFYVFHKKLKNKISKKTYIELAKSTNNPQIQLQILREIGI